MNSVRIEKKVLLVDDEPDITIAIKDRNAKGRPASKLLLYHSSRNVL
jgi:hypothetical protein